VLILASQSPRRRELLHLAGFDFMVRARPVEEIRAAGEAPEDYVRRLAREKAAASQESPDEIVLGADTTVVVDHHVLEKPVNHDDARRMLRLLSGREHTVLTGIALLHRGQSIIDVESTRVHFVAMSEAEIDRYISSGEPMDKAGAYAIQGLASKFIDRIEGCYFNVVGLPISLVYFHLKKLTK